MEDVEKHPWSLGEASQSRKYVIFHVKKIRTSCLTIAGLKSHMCLWLP